jgi:hypothetical protein
MADSWQQLAPQQLVHHSRDWAVFKDTLTVHLYLTRMWSTSISSYHQKNLKFGHRLALEKKLIPDKVTGF